LLTQELLKTILQYDPETGIFVRLASTQPYFIGKPAGCPTARGYITIQILGRRYPAHRLAWLYMTGDWPEFIIDHKNGDVADNSFTNLREANGAKNSYNMRKSKANTSGIKGVYLHKKTQMWAGVVTYGGSRYWTGSHPTKEAAEQAVRAKREELHGEYTNHG